MQPEFSAIDCDWVGMVDLNPLAKPPLSRRNRPSGENRSGLSQDPRGSLHPPQSLLLHQDVKGTFTLQLSNTHDAQRKAQAVLLTRSRGCR
jgi:hypothetical protein